MLNIDFILFQAKRKEITCPILFLQQPLTSVLASKLSPLLWKVSGFSSELFHNGL